MHIYRAEFQNAELIISILFSLRLSCRKSEHGISHNLGKMARNVKALIILICDLILLLFH